MGVSTLPAFEGIQLRGKPYCCSAAAEASAGNSTPTPDGYAWYRERHVGANSPSWRWGYLPVTGSGVGGFPAGCHSQCLTDLPGLCVECDAGISGNYEPMKSWAWRLRLRFRLGVLSFSRRPQRHMTEESSNFLPSLAPPMEGRESWKRSRTVRTSQNPPAERRPTLARNRS